MILFKTQSLSRPAAQYDSPKQTPAWNYIPVDELANNYEMTLPYSRIHHHDEPSMQILLQSFHAYSPVPFELEGRR